MKSEKKDSLSPKMTITLIANYLPAILETKCLWNIFKMLVENNHQSQILYPTKLSFK